MSSLKRTADGSEFDVALSSKRAALEASPGEQSSDIQLHLLKMLCPNSVIGSIIGRGGSVINALNQSTGARIKLSQNNQFFPTTNDRVIAISGSQETINVALTELITKMVEAPDKNTDTAPSTSARSLQVRILIPMLASGVIIGRQGSVIKSMSEKSSCHMQLAEMNDPYETNERIMIVNSKNGVLEDLIGGAHIAVAQLFSEVSLCVYNNPRPSYGENQESPQQRRPSMNGNTQGQGGGMGGGMGGGGQGQGGQGQGGRNMMGGQGGQPMYQQGYQGVPMGDFVFDPRNLGHNNGGYQQQMMQQPGFRPQQNYPQGGQGQGQGQYPNQGRLVQVQVQGTGGGQAGGGGMGGGGGQGGGGQRGFEQRPYQSGYQQPDFGAAQQSAMSEVSPAVFSADGASITMTLGVPDSLVGAILGRSGCVVKEIMSLSGTQIQISQKDAVSSSPGENKFRQVKVVGLQHQVQVAQSMIMAKMQSQPPQLGAR